MWRLHCTAFSSQREWVWQLTQFAGRKWRSGLNRISHPDWMKLSVELNFAPNKNTNFPFHYSPNYNWFHRHPHVPLTRKIMLKNKYLLCKIKAFSSLCCRFIDVHYYHNCHYYYYFYSQQNMKIKNRNINRILFKSLQNLKPPIHIDQMFPTFSAWRLQSLTQEDWAKFTR